MVELIFYIIIAILVFDYLLERLLDYLNSLLWSNDLPAELEGIYDADKYKRSQEYTRTNTRFSIYSDTVSFIAMMLMLLLGGFAFLDGIVEACFVFDGFFNFLRQAAGCKGQRHGAGYEQAGDCHHDSVAIHHWSPYLGCGWLLHAF